MTIGGAIAELQNLINADDVPFYYKGGIEKVIETISMEFPTIEVSEDCISREWVLQMLTTYEKDRSSANELDEWQNRVVEWVEMDIEDAPSVVPTTEQSSKVGEWELLSDDDGEYGICSICGNDADFTHYGEPYNYCPNCGAKMKGADEE